MRKVVVSEFISLDGVVQAPIYADEDASGDFRHGGWHPGYFEAMSMQWVVETVTGAGGFLLGRGTYERFAAHWPKASEAEQALARPMNALPKLVASRTLEGPLPWQNARLIKGDVPAAVAELKQEDGKDLVVFGSPVLARTLIAHDLVDEFRLMMDPVVLGSGKRLFHGDEQLRTLRLVSCQPVATGAMLVTYARARG
ncbi:MAG: Bifunctional deaminase-reductase domain protein [Holophagaceae bacterium]|nr:Bifunctional deaminase-reductase domain protein [Holophagaceae bacterium]